MYTTCGIFIVNNNNEILLGHPTHSSHSELSIPKGLLQKDELPIDAAIRETKEECGLIIPKDKLKYVGKSIYKSNKKQLIAFFVKYDFNINECKCSSFVELLDKRFPEIDYFRKLDIQDAFKFIHITQQELLRKILEY